MKNLLIAIAVLLATVPLFGAEAEIENFETYEECSVFERVDSFTDKRTIFLSCYQEADELDFIAEDAYITIWTEAEQPGKSGMIIFNTGEIFWHSEKTIKLRYRFDKNELQEYAGVGYNSDTFSAYLRVSSTTVHSEEGERYTVSAAEMMKQHLDWLAKSDKVVFDLGGYATATIELTGAKEAVADFRERIEKLKPSEDEAEEPVPVESEEETIIMEETNE